MYCLPPYSTTFAHTVYRFFYCVTDCTFVYPMCNSVLLFCFALSWPSRSCKWELVINWPTWLNKGEKNRWLCHRRWSSTADRRLHLGIPLCHCLALICSLFTVCPVALLLYLWREGFCAPEWRSGLRHCISVLEVSLQYLVQIQAASHLAVIGSRIGRHTIGAALSGFGRGRPSL